MKPAESLYVKVDGGPQLHLRHFPGPGHPVFLVHGAIENGRIFYSDNGKGFAPYLQKQGFDVYVLDLRGRGKSLPTLRKGAEQAGTLETPKGKYSDAAKPAHKKRKASPSGPWE